jgi:hypothetical protein
MRDAEISYRAGKWVVERCGAYRLTLPSLSLYVYRKRFEPVFTLPTIDEGTKLKLQQAYRGGRVEPAVRGAVKGKVRVYDFRSLYPFVMKTYKYPVYSQRTLKHKFNINLCKEGIAEAVVKQEGDFPPLGVHLHLNGPHHRLVFPKGKIRGWFVYPELRYLEAGGWGKIVKVYQAFETDYSDYLFSDFVDWGFEQIRRHPEEKPFWKLFLNSLYGKYGQSPEVDLYRISGGKYEKLEDGGGAFRNNFMLASYITAYARLHLHRWICRMPSQNYIYSDTDSIHTLDYRLETGENIGNLKLEWQNEDDDGCVYVRSKFYILGDKLICRGAEKWISAENMRTAISQNRVEFINQALLRIRAAHRRGFEPLSVVPKPITITTAPDPKRKYLKSFDGAKLLTDFTYSQPITVRGG